MQVNELVEGVLRGDRRSLAKAITLVESRNPEHMKQAKVLLESILPKSGNSVRIGISGVPGVGKSTFIEVFGLYLIKNGHRVAVLAVDPTSALTGGSLLGDKVRMQNLSADQNAFIRPSPSGDSLGGVARRTRESMFLCEAAGYDVVVVETVGVGQSDISVSSMVDFFLLMQLPNAGDEIQGIKRGVMEVCDAIVVNKADGDNLPKARLARVQLENALSILRTDYGWKPPVLLVSAKEKRGIDKVWFTILEYKHRMELKGFFGERRRKQNRQWMWDIVMDSLKKRFFEDESIRDEVVSMEKALDDNLTTPFYAAEHLLNVFFGRGVKNDYRYKSHRRSREES